jgi:peptidoglycan/LPS O-acetylase OafA/YrhL
MTLPQAKRDIGPDLLRALAILLVMVWHLPKAGLPPAMLTIREFGWLGVDIFFVLSGYLIGTELLRQVRNGRKPDLPAFYTKRAFRILPMFWLTLAAYVLLPAWGENPNLAPVWRYLTFTVNFGLDYRLTGAFTHAWSLCVEEHFYLLLPAIILLLRRWSSPLPVILLATTLLVVGMVLRHLIWQDWSASGEGAAAMLRDLYYPTYTRLDGLLMGVCLAAFRLFRPQLWQATSPWLTLPLGTACLAIAGYMTMRDGITLSPLGAILLYPLFAFGVAIILAGVLKFETHLQALRWTGAGFIAAISYSLYLSHKLVMHADKALLPKAWLDGWSGVLIYYATSIIVAALLYLMVERTFLKLRQPVLQRLS